MTHVARPIDAEELLANAGWLRALAQGLVADGHRADDVVQQTFVAAIERPPGADVPLRPWLARVARNVSIQFLRSEERRARHESAASAPPAPSSPGEGVARTEMFHAVVGAVLALEPMYRDVVIARFFDGLDMPQVAVRLGVPVETARTRLKRALATLRDRLDRKYGDRRAWALLLSGRRAAPAAAAVAGGVVMAKKVAVATAVVLVLLLGGWYALDSRDDGSPAPRQAVAEATAPVARQRAAPPAGKAPIEPAAPPVATLPTATGRVVDPVGRPIAGARVVSIADDVSTTMPPASGGAESSRTFAVTSDADGRFTVGLDATCPAFTLYAESADAGPATVGSVRPGEDVTIVLAPHRNIAGKVSDADGRPVAGAKVRLCFLFDVMRFERTAVTGDDGTYRVDHVPPEEKPDPIVWTDHGRAVMSWAIVDAGGFAPLFVFVTDGWIRRPTPAYDFVVLRGATLTGHVVDAESGAGIGGARVVAWSDEGGHVAYGGASGGGYVSNPWGERVVGETTSADDGSFRLDHIPAEGSQRMAAIHIGEKGRQLGSVLAMKDGYASAGDEVPVVKDGAAIETTLRMWPAATIEGRVVDPSGRPIARAYAFARVEGRSSDVPYLPAIPELGDTDRWNGRTDTEGRFHLVALASRAGPSDVRISVAVRVGRGNADAEATAVVTEGAAIALPDIVIDSAGVPQASILVVDESGRPVPGALIGDFRDTVRTGVDGRALFGRDFRPAPFAPVGATKEERLRAAREVPREDVSAPIPLQSLTVLAKGFAPTTVEFTPSRGTPADVRVVVHPGASMSGRVQFADGRPVGRAVLQVINGRMRPDEVFDANLNIQRPNRRDQPTLIEYGRAVAADDGTFTVEHLPDGPYLVAAGAWGRTRHLSDVRENVPDGATNLVFTLPVDDGPAAGSLDVVVTDADGEPVDAAAVRAWKFATPVFSASKGRGRFAFASLPGGRWTVRAQASGYVTAEATVAIGSGASAPLRLELRRGATIRGVVRVGAGALPEGLSVVVQELGWAPGDPTSARALPADGAFSMTGFAPGRYRLLVTSAGVPPQTFVPQDSAVVVVPAGEAEVVADRAFVPSGMLSFRFQDARLAKSPAGGFANDDAHEQFSARATLDVLDARGEVVHTERPVWADFAMPAQLAPGDYVVRLTIPGEAPRLQTCTVRAGATVGVRFASE